MTGEVGPGRAIAVPAIERTFVAADPQHNVYWFPLIGSMVNLIPNTDSATALRCACS